jgi:hypothetical protein
METIRLAIDAAVVNNLHMLRKPWVGVASAWAQLRIPKGPYRRNGDDRTANIAKDVEIGAYIDCQI